jgi:hypothetical protein
MRLPLILAERLGDGSLRKGLNLSRRLLVKKPVKS